MRPLEVVKGKPVTLGRVDEGWLVVWIVVTAAAVLGIYLVTWSNLGAWLALLALAAPLRWMRRKAAISRPFPPCPDPPPPVHRLARWGKFPVCALLAVVIGELASRVGGGFWFWFFVGFIAPLSFVINRYGVQAPTGRQRTWRIGRPSDRTL